MAAGSVTVTVEVPEVVMGFLEALRDIVQLCIDADDAGQDTVSIDAIEAVIAPVLDKVGAES